jgi:2-succinyl-5-enolpyruvyl-6-hydroxy-3-cyclohexene-1-carboxylate synthase
VTLVCTSGTAAANFLPAVIEAWYARVPLVVLTADRPHELRGVGAPQTIDQLNLFGTHVKWFVDLAEPDAAPEMLRYVRTVAGRAVATALRGPAGPVHINCPYREPLMPNGALAAKAPERRADQRPYVAVRAGLRAPDMTLVARLAAELRNVERGLIVCGAQDDASLNRPLTQLAQALGFPILADPLSGLRCGDHDRALVIDSYDAFLRDSAFAERFAPELVLRFGAMPVSKPLLLYLQRHHGCRQILIDGDAGWNEPTLLASDVLHVDGRLLCTALLERLTDRDHRAYTEKDLEATSSVISVSAVAKKPSGWAQAWCGAAAGTRVAIAKHMHAIDELFEGKVFAELSALLPENAIVYAGNSMPIRDLDTFFSGGKRAIRLLGNRGANGIDGVVSSALGASAAGVGPTVLVIGDLSFYHDSNGLLASKLHGLNATIILLNNDGGGIFSFLPQASDPEHFEMLFGTPHGLDFQPLAQVYGARYSRVANWEAFRMAVRRGLEGDGLQIVEVPTDRERNVALHREFWPLVSQALAAFVGKIGSE